MWDDDKSAYTDTGATYQGNTLYPVFFADEPGRLCVEYPDGYSGPSFVLNERGELEVNYESSAGT